MDRKRGLPHFVADRLSRPDAAPSTAARAHHRDSSFVPIATRSIGGRSAIACRLGDIVVDPVHRGWFLAVAAACGSSPASAPDAAVDAVAGHDLSIGLFRHAAFADGDTENALLVAIQDGDGAWAAATGERGVYRAHLSSERYGVAIACRTGASSRIAVFQRTVADGLALRTRSCDADPIELDVAVQHVPARTVANLSTIVGLAGGGDSTYAFFAPPGPAELFASLTDVTGRLTWVVRMPAFDLQARQSMAIDFATQGSAPEERALTVALGPLDDVRVSTSVIRPSGEYPLGAPAALASPAVYQVLPLALWQADDLFAVTVESGARSTTITSKVPGALAFELPAAQSAQAPALAIAPALRPSFAFATAATFLPFASYSLLARTASAPDSVREWSAELSASWVAGAAMVHYEFPDLSALTGFQPELDLLDRGPVRWSVRRTESTFAAPGDGRITRSAISAGVIDGYCGDHAIQAPETCDPPDGTTCGSACTKL